MDVSCESNQSNSKNTKRGRISPKKKKKRTRPKCEIKLAVFEESTEKNHVLFSSTLKRDVKYRSPSILILLLNLPIFQRSIEHDRPSFSIDFKRASRIILPRIVRRAVVATGCANFSTWNYIRGFQRVEIRGTYALSLAIRCLRGLLIRKVAEQDRVETRGDIRTASFDKGKTGGEDVYVQIYFAGWIYVP